MDHNLNGVSHPKRESSFRRGYFSAIRPSSFPGRSYPKLHADRTVDVETEQPHSTRPTRTCAPPPPATSRALTSQNRFVVLLSHAAESSVRPSRNAPRERRRVPREPGMWDFP